MLGFSCLFHNKLHQLGKDLLKISNKEIRNTYTKEFSEYYLVFTRYLPTRIKFITGIEKKQKDFYTMYKIPADSMRKKKEWYRSFWWFRECLRYSGLYKKVQLNLSIVNILYSGHLVIPDRTCSIPVKLL